MSCVSVVVDKQGFTAPTLQPSVTAICRIGADFTCSSDEYAIVVCGNANYELIKRLHDTMTAAIPSLAPTDGLTFDGITNPASYESIIDLKGYAPVVVVMEMHVDLGLIVGGFLMLLAWAITLVSLKPMATTIWT
eukprot:m.85207 g.85207  ORF g.85207 m.85207 type:complete len:135 (-) comp14714_c0_seq3:382-786(-)